MVLSISQPETTPIRVVHVQSSLQFEECTCAPRRSQSRGGHILLHCACSKRRRNCKIVFFSTNYRSICSWALGELTYEIRSFSHKSFEHSPKPSTHPNYKTNNASNVKNENHQTQIILVNLRLWEYQNRIQHVKKPLHAKYELRSCLERRIMTILRQKTSKKRI